MPGQAMRMRDTTTWAMAILAIFFELPIFSPFSSSMAMPSCSSVERIIGMLIQLAAATRFWGFTEISCDIYDITNDDNINHYRQ